jgi:hypothetical protein
MANKKIYTIRLLRKLNDAGELSPEQITRLENIGFPFKANSKCRQVTCLETEETWASVKDAASSMGVSTTVLSGALKTGRDVDGSHFYYSDSPKPDSDFFRLTRRARPVRCLEDGTLYESIGAVARALHCKTNSVLAACQRGVSANGLHFYYADESIPSADFFSKGTTTPREIVCIETGEVFLGQGETARHFHASRSAIGAAVSRGSSVKGFHFTYRDQVNGELPSLKPSRVRSVRCIETGEVFPSIAEANQKLGKARRSGVISNAIRCGSRAYGYHWEYIDEQRKMKRQRKIRCIENERIFDCLRSASEYAAVSRSAICSAIDRGGTSGGYHWEYVDD